MTKQQIFDIRTPGRGMTNVTAQVVDIVSQSKIAVGTCNVFLHHTSASIIICENYDPAVQTDLERFMQRLIPDGDKIFEHILEGPDDMPSHVKTILTQSSLTIPVTENKLALGQWQGIFLWEHRLEGHQRRITVTVQG